MAFRFGNLMFTYRFFCLSCSFRLFSVSFRKFCLHQYYGSPRFTFPIYNREFCFLNSADRARKKCLIAKLWQISFQYNSGCRFVVIAVRSTATLHETADAVLIPAESTAFTFRSAANSNPASDRAANRSNFA